MRRAGCLQQRVGLALISCLMLVTSCASPGRETSGDAAPRPDAAPSSGTPDGLSIAIGREPLSLVPSIGTGASGPSEHLFELVHQSLISYDDRGVPLARLASELPSISNGTWKIELDGSMETTWKLRPGVRWHDGRPLIANDVIFSWRVFSDPSAPVASRRVARLIDSMDSPDPTTVVMHWSSHYAFADQVSGFDLTILPRHILETTFDLRREQFGGHAFWQSQFVGLGPFRLQRWVAGSSIELSAFDGYFLGAPALRTVSVRFVADDNTALSAALSGTVDIVLPRRAAPGIVRTVSQQWSNKSEGRLALLPGANWVFYATQLRSPQPEDLMDPRVRQALSLSLDRVSMAEALTGDATMAAEVWVPRADARFDAVTQRLTLNQYDRARAAELFREVGWRRESADDVLVKQGRRFEIDTSTTVDWEQVAGVLADYWRGGGVVAKETVYSLATLSDRQSRSSFTGTEIAASVPNIALLEGRLHSSNVPSPSNQWIGPNRGNYVNLEADRLVERVLTTVIRGEREGYEQQLAQLVSHDLPFSGLFFFPSIALIRSTAAGVQAPATVPLVGRSYLTWNAHLWARS